jgi:stringent starvation protein B
VHVDASVRVPMEFVKNGEIVLNVSLDATSALRLGNDFIEFKARFGGVAREIVVPVSHVVAIYARENGQGMAFPAPAVVAAEPAAADDPASSTASRPAGVASRNPLRAVPVDSSGAEEVQDSPAEPTPNGPGRGGRPQLKRVK